MNDKVFISYAKEDYDFALKLYNFLKANDFKPWLDKKEILTGQSWDFCTKRALRDANYIILLLSDNSIKKKGYDQQEFKLALEYYEENLDNDLNLLPLKIDDCEIPQNLSNLQWIANNKKDDFILVLESLNLQRQKNTEKERSLLASKDLYAKEVFVQNFVYGDINGYKIRSRYFQFIEENNPNIIELNTLLKGKNTELTVLARKDFFDISGELIKNEDSDVWWEYDISFSPSLISKSVISINEDLYSFTGGAHGNSFTSGINYHLNPTLKINIEDLFEYEEHEKVLNFISDFCYEKLRKKYNVIFEIPKEEIQKQEKHTLFWEDCLSPKWKNFNTFLISKHGLEIIFNAYTVSSYEFGIHYILIPYNDLIPILNNTDKLKYLNDVLN